jgi:hypothetical protein
MNNKIKKNTICKSCGIALIGVGNATKYCEKCRKEIKAKYDRKIKEKIRATKRKELICLVCGEKINDLKQNTKICKKEKCRDTYLKSLNKSYYFTNREKMISYHKKYQEEHAQEHVARQKKYLKNKKSI